MSNNKNKRITTKLKGTETRNYQNKPHSSLNNDFVASGSHTSDVQEQSIIWNDSVPKLIPEPKQAKCGGRGLAIARLAESMSTSSKKSINDCNYSNKTIESHFQNLREENSKKLKEKNEQIWGKLIHSKKKS